MDVRKRAGSHRASTLDTGHGVDSRVPGSGPAVDCRREQQRVRRAAANTANADRSCFRSGGTPCVRTGHFPYVPGHRDSEVLVGLPGRFGVPSADEVGFTVPRQAAIRQESE